MFVDKDKFMLPVFGLWVHTADGLPPPGCLVLGYNLIQSGGCAVLLLRCEYEVDEDGDIASEPEWYRCFVELARDENPPLPAPIAWAECRFNFPSEPLGTCDDCGGYYKGLNNPCDSEGDDE